MGVGEGEKFWKSIKPFLDKENFELVRSGELLNDSNYRRKGNDSSHGSLESRLGPEVGPGGSIDV